MAVLFVCVALHNAPSNAQQANCTIQDTFPKNYTSPPSHFGASRSSGARWHAGVDFFLPPANSLSNPTAPRTRVDIPFGCQIHLYSDGTAIWKSDPTGYGNYMFLGCGNHGGDDITLRYAHITGYDTDTQEIIQGRSGIETASIPDHYHFEVLIGNVPVDPECVLGLEKGDGPNSPIPECRQCPTAGGPANLCDASVRDALIRHSDVCHRGRITKSVPSGTSTVDPNRMGGNGVQGDPNAGVGTNPGTFGGHGDDGHYHNHDISPSDEYGGDVDTLYPPTSTIPPPPPKAPPPSGTTDGPADLVIDATGSHDVTGCAVDTWTAMVNQAVLEARRETIMYQKLIAKADSVITYTCFDDVVRNAAANIGPIFSETSDWVDRTVNILPTDVTISRELGADSLDGSLTMLVDQMMAPYLTQSFSHGLLGETAGSISVPSGACSVMENVWNAAKCKNADAPFYTFEDLVTNNDPRDVPSSFDCGAP
ncbi:MAG: hypothetical protein HRT94_02480 [Alphaproteobacteria bacterium]|nr:hypothetical protein [Alphaproteobacteria bacterium]